MLLGQAFFITDTKLVLVRESVTQQQNCIHLLSKAVCGWLLFPLSYSCKGMAMCKQLQNSSVYCRLAAQANRKLALKQSGKHQLQPSTIYYPRSSLLSGEFLNLGFFCGIARVFFNDIYRSTYDGQPVLIASGHSSSRILKLH